MPTTSTAGRSDLRTSPSDHLPTHELRGPLRPCPPSQGRNWPRGLSSRKELLTIRDQIRHGIGRSDRLACRARVAGVGKIVPGAPLGPPPTGSAGSPSTASTPTPPGSVRAQCIHGRIDSDCRPFAHDAQIVMVAVLLPGQLKIRWTTYVAWMFPIYPVLTS